MCGICGMFDAAGADGAHVRAMAATMAHRGPDDAGLHVDGPIGMGHRRLSIIDLEGGHQPLSNEDGSVWIVFNGDTTTGRCGSNLQDGVTACARRRIPR
jgi:asparagine synthase (glutamine-hydrolysing)